MIFVTKCGTCLNFINCSTWFPRITRQMSHLQAISSQILWILSSSMVAAASVIRAHNSSKLAVRGRTEALCLTYLHTEKSRGLSEVIVVAKLSFQHAQSKQPPFDWGRKISRQLCTSGMTSGGLNENLSIGRKFWCVPDHIDSSSSGSYGSRSLYN